jgi:hypothetical protein
MLAAVHFLLICMELTWSPLSTDIVIMESVNRTYTVYYSSRSECQGAKAPNFDEFSGFSSIPYDSSRLKALLQVHNQWNKGDEEPDR